MKRITVLLAEDHLIVREGLRKILEADPDLQVIGEAQDGRAAVAAALKLRPAVVLMDVSMPLLNGLEATRQLLKALPNLKVIILSAHNEDAYVANAIECGAVGFLFKSNSASEVGLAIRQVAAGGTSFSSTQSRPDLPVSAAQIQQRVKAAQLSSREMEVLQLIAEGKGNKQTAALLGIGIKTVEKHREHVMRKLDIHDTAGLTRYAIAAGIIESNVLMTITG